MNDSIIILALIGINILGNIYKEGTWYQKHKDFVDRKQQYFFGTILFICSLIVLGCGIFLMDYGEGRKGFLLGAVLFLLFMFTIPIVGHFSLKCSYIKWDAETKMNGKADEEKYTELEFQRKLLVWVAVCDAFAAGAVIFICWKWGLPDKVQDLINTSTWF